MAIQLSNQQKQYIGAGVFLFFVASGLYVYFFWLPISQKMSELTTQIADIDTKIRKARAQASRLDKLQDELRKLHQQAAEADQRLPKTKSVPDMLVSLAALAQANRVNILSFTPGPSKSQQYFTELTYPMTVKGSYNNIGRFFAAISLEERIFNVKDVVYPTAAGDGQMTVTFVLLTYESKG